MVATDDGGRVTLAVISQKLDDIIRRLERMERCVESLDARMQAVERAAAIRDQQIANLAEDVERLQNRDFWGTFGAGLAAVVAGVIGWFK